MSDQDKPNKAEQWNAANEKNKKEWPTESAEGPAESTSELNSDKAEQADSETPALDHPSYKKLEQELTDMEQKVHDYWNQVLRARAEVENIQNRAEKDVVNARKYALEKFAVELLQVADSLDQGLQLQVGENDLAKSIHQGLELTHTLMHSVMEKYGIKLQNPMGEKFDPNLHKAISMVESPDVESGTIINVMQKGYTLNERVIRPAMVVVSK